MQLASLNVKDHLQISFESSARREVIFSDNILSIHFRNVKFSLIEPAIFPFASYNTDFSALTKGIYEMCPENFHGRLYSKLLRGSRFREEAVPAAFSLAIVGRKPVERGILESNLSDIKWQLV